jgi:hypothetical protein
MGVREALAIARIDPTLVDHMLVACVRLRAVEEGTSPRTILEHTFRRAVSDADWDTVRPSFTSRVGALSFREAPGG